MPPVIFLAFANSKDAYLDGLENEQRAISDALRLHRDSNRIAVETSFSTTVADIFNAFTRYKDRIAVLHYAGHADGAHLELRDGVAVAQGLADLIRVQTHKPELVFLNGCATGGQVNALLEAGVKAVIATSVPINDDAAHTLASGFYRALATYCTVQEAFDTALAELTMRGRQLAQVHRSLSWEGKDGDSTDPAIWGLFGETDWRIPTLAAPVPLEELDLELMTLLETVFGEMHERFGYGKEVLEAIESEQAPLGRQALIKVFPLPISIELEPLFQVESQRKIAEQVRQMLLLYGRAGQFYVHTLLAQLWETTQPLPAAVVADIRQFLAQNTDEWRTFRYLRFAHTLANALRAQGISLFFEVDAYDSSAEERLESLRQRWAKRPMSQAEASEVFNQTIEDLSEVLKAFAPLADGYRMLSVREILLYNFRHQPQASYQHIHSVLAKIVKEGTNYLPMRPQPNYTESYSVLLAKYDKQENILASINLSPFVVDKNAFEKDANTPNLLLLVHEQGGKWWYENPMEKQHWFSPSPEWKAYTLNEAAAPAKKSLFKSSGKGAAATDGNLDINQHIVRQFEALLHLLSRS